MLGIFEYIQDDFGGFKSAPAFLANAFRWMKPGGALVAASMLYTHPQIHFIQRAIGWPSVLPGSVEQIHSIVTDAGIDPAWVTMKIMDNGVHAVFEIAEPDPTCAAEPVAI
jgi:cyclopropane fatty-acyl-phospholipid synthase-like methyltransferase